MEVTDIFIDNINTDFGVVVRNINLSLEELNNKKYKVSIDIDKDPEIHNSSIINKDKLCNLSSSTNSTLFKNMKHYNRDDILKAIIKLESKLDNTKRTIEKEEKKSLANKKNDILKNGEAFFKQCVIMEELPSNIIMKLSEWKVANEQVNVLKIVLCILSTMKGQPINIISEASSGSGKSLIEDTAFSMVHPHNHLTLNGSTIASFRYEGLNNPYLYENKVIRFGDLGSKAMEERLEEVKSVIKVLNSEGYFSDKRMIGADESVVIELVGHCAMCMSKVSNDKEIDSQDSSRGIIWVPALNNDIEFSNFTRWEGIKNDDDDEYIKDVFNDIRDYLEYLVSLDLKIINPFVDVLNFMFRNNETYRRLYAKQNNLLKMLALINLPNKDIIDDEYGKRIYVSCEDFELYYKLFYNTLIGFKEFNVGEKDMNLLDSLKLNYNIIKDNDVNDAFTDVLDDNNSEFYSDSFLDNNSFFTVNDIVENMSNVRSVHNLIGNISSDREKKNIIRNTLRKLHSFIGVYIMPDSNWHTNPQYKPNLYYLKDSNVFGNSFKYTIKYKTLSLINDYYGSEDVERIIIDVKNSCDKSKVTNEKVVGCITDIIDDSVFNTSMVKVPSYLSEGKKIGDIIDISKYL